jgi:hypothetical protein
MSLQRAQTVNRLNDNDQFEDRRLKETFTLPIWHAPCDGAVETFQRMLATVRQFVMKGDEEDSKRGMIAGFLWIEEGVVVNTRDLGTRNSN